MVRNRRIHLLELVRSKEQWSEWINILIFRNNSELKTLDHFSLNSYRCFHGNSISRTNKWYIIDGLQFNVSIRIPDYALFGNGVFVSIISNILKLDGFKINKSHLLTFLPNLKITSGVFSRFFLKNKWQIYVYLGNTGYYN